MKTDFTEWYQAEFPRLTGHGMWLRGGELNTVLAETWDARPFRVLFSRLSTYYDTADSFTHSYLYQLAAALEGVFPDLAYLPPRNDVEKFNRDNVPFLLGTQSKRPGVCFDLIGFSNSTVQELLNLPQFLRSSGIPLSKKQRMSRPELPLVLLGGANALYSGVAWGEDPWVDLVFVGESGEAIRMLLHSAQAAKKAGLSKHDTLDQLSKLEGVIIPDGSNRTRKAVGLNLNDGVAFHSGPVMFTEDQAGCGQVQISEGCPCFCTFCAESWERKPYRERTVAKILETARHAKASRGLQEIDLYSFNFNMHSGFYPLLWELIPRFRSIGLKSQRFDLLAHDPVMAEVQHSIDKASFTCGLEGISTRLRTYLRKNLTNADLKKSISSIFKSRCRELKIFLIATGKEKEADLNELSEFLEDLKKIRNSAHSGARIIFSMTPLVRFPWTPLEFDDSYPIEHYSKIISKTAGLVKRAGFEFREAAELAENWISQVMVRCADPRVGATLASVLEKTGFLYFRSIPENFQKTWKMELEKAGLGEKDLLKGSLPTTSDYPWLRVEIGVKRDFVVALWQDARQGLETDYCLGRAWVTAKCSACGACPSAAHVRGIVAARQERPYTVDAFKQHVKAVKTSLRPVRVLVRIGERALGLSRPTLAAAVARAMMQNAPELVDGYMGSEGSVLGDGLNECWLSGEDVLTFSFRGKEISRAMQLLGDPLWLNKVNEELGPWGQLLGMAQSEWKVAQVSLSGGRARIEQYLKAKGYKFTTRKNSDHDFQFELSPQSVKKGFMQAVELQVGDTRSEIRIIAGPKFGQAELVQLQKESFTLAHPEDWVRVKCRINC